ncbi:MAG: ankyrin repeat domain-containing protein [Planctomycetota bacterium]
MTTSDPAPGSNPKKLPRDPSVEHLRKQAKSLLKAHQRGLAPATQRVAAVFQDKSIKLTDAQHVVAVEYGFPSWPKLAAHVRSVTGDAADWHRDPNDNLPKAANDGDRARITKLLAAGDFTQHDLDLGLARATHQHLDIAAMLIEHGADPNGEYGGNYGPILLAPCEGCNVEGIRFLLEHGAEPNADPDRTTKYANHNTPMRMLLGSYMRPGMDRRREAIDLLVEYGADVPPEVDDIAWTIFRDDAETLGILLASDPGRIAHRFHGFDYGNIKLEGATYLHQAVEFQAQRCVDVLCARGYEHGIEINTKADTTTGPIADRRDFRGGGQTPIFHCVASNGGGNFPMLEHLIQKYGRWIDFTATATIHMYSWKTGRDETLRDVTPLQMAEANFNPDDANPWWKTRDRELEILRQRDARSAMERAVEAGDFPTATELMDQHPEHVGPHLWAAAVHEARSLELVNELLRRGLDPNARADPRSALDLACYFGDVEMIQALVAAGAEVNTVNALGERPADLLGRYEPIDDATRVVCRSALGLPND